MMIKHSPLELKLPIAAAEFPWTSRLGLPVKDTRTSRIPMLSNLCFSSSLSASTAIAAVISLWTLTGTVFTNSLIRSTAPASTMARLFRSELAAKFRNVDIAWHWTSSLSSYESKAIKGSTNPASIMGDSFAVWMEIFRMHATDDKIRAKDRVFSNRSRGGRPFNRTISSWYFSKDMEHC